MAEKDKTAGVRTSNGGKTAGDETRDATQSRCSAGFHPTFKSGPNTPSTPMPASRGQPINSGTELDAYQAEVIVLVAYVKLSFGTYQLGQDCAATLMAFKHCELRLTSPVQSTQMRCALRVELFDHVSLSVVESRATDSIADAAFVLLELIPFAEAYEPTFLIHLPGPNA